ncbi:MAG: type II toxin-antitoxin system VapC family toxin [Chitinophagales bacterium]
MNVLIDTHALIWYIEGNRQLSSKAIEAIDNDNNQVFVSKASLWEMVIKLSLKKLDISIEFKDLESMLARHNILVLDFDFAHLKPLLTLPFHHKDPFDRLIIAQAMTEDIHVITKDSYFEAYPVKILW